MNYQNYLLVALMGLVANSTMQAMETRQPLPLKYLCADTVSRLANDNPQATNYCLLPEELQEYTSLCASFAQLLPRILETLVDESGDRHSLYQTYAYSLRTVFNSLLENNNYEDQDPSCLQQILNIDRSVTPANHFLSLLNQLSSDYSKEEKLSVLSALTTGKDKFIKEERMLFTHMLHKAIAFDHRVLIAFLSKKGAYILKQLGHVVAHTDLQQDEYDFSGSAHIYAFRLSNIPAIKILIQCREYRASLKEPDKQEISLEKFFDECPENFPSATPLSIALAIGNCEMLSLYIEAIKRNNLDLYKYMKGQDASGNTAMMLAISPDHCHECCEDFKYVLPDSGKIETMHYFLSVAHEAGFSMLDFFSPLQSVVYTSGIPVQTPINTIEAFYSETAITNLAFFRSLLDQALTYEIDPACILAPVLNTLLIEYRNIIYQKRTLTKKVSLRMSLAQHDPRIAALIKEQDVAWNNTTNVTRHKDAINFIIAFMVEHCITIDDLDKILMLAALNGDFDNLETFIRYGFIKNLNTFFNAPDDSNHTLLTRLAKGYGTFGRSHKVFKQLLSFAKAHNIDLFGLPEAFEIAKAHDNIKLIKMFVKLGIASLDLQSYTSEQDTNNETVLMRLTTKCLTNELKALLQMTKEQNIALPDVAQALTIARDGIGSAPYDMVKVFGLLLPLCTDLNIAQFLNTPNNQGQTVINRLLRICRGNMKDFLISSLRIVLKPHHIALYKNSDGQLVWGHFGT